MFAERMNIFKANMLFYQYLALSRVVYNFDFVIETQKGWSLEEIFHS